MGAAMMPVRNHMQRERGESKGVWGEAGARDQSLGLGGCRGGIGVQPRRVSHHARIA